MVKTIPYKVCIVGKNTVGNGLDRSYHTKKRADYSVRFTLFIIFFDLLHNVRGII